MTNHRFISYSSADAQEFAFQLADALAAGPPPFPVWLDKCQLLPGEDWDEQIADAIRTCDSLLFVMTLDSVEDRSVCKQEAIRLITVTGRGGIGKTTLICRLLQALEDGELPDEGGPLAVDGIVYLSANGSRQVNTPNLFADLGKLLPEDDAARVVNSKAGIVGRALRLFDALVVADEAAILAEVRAAAGGEKDGSL